MRVETTRPLADPPPAQHSFLVGQDRAGHWLAVETHGFGGGIFVSRDAALRYALGETNRRADAVRLAQRPISLS